MGNRILVAQNDLEDSRRIAQLFLQQGFETVIADTGEHFLVKLQQDDHWELFVLDSFLPDVDAIDLCRMVRGVSNAPILVLSRERTEDLEIRLLDAGADEFLCKPIGAIVLLARISAILRQHRLGAPLQIPPQIQQGSLVINRDRREVHLSHRQVKLTPTEFDLLAILAGNPGQVLDVRSLVREVLGYEATMAEAQNLIKVHIHNLRHKLEEKPEASFHITNVRGAGYMFDRRRLPRSDQHMVI